MGPVCLEPWTHFQEESCSEVSLVVQWLRLCAPHAWGPASTPGQGTRSHMLQLRAWHCCCCLVTKSCPTLCDPMDCSPPRSAVHGILQARTPDGLPGPLPGYLPDPGIEPTSPALQVASLLMSHAAIKRSYVLQQRQKILCAATKTWHRQNK